MSQILVLGSNFGGVTAAIELKKRLGKNHEVTVISPSENFLYVPSLIWVPFGRRTVDEITFPIKPVLEKKGIKFLQDKATQILAEENIVKTENNGELKYDYLVVATGVGLKWDIIENLDPEKGYINSIITPKLAEASYEKFKELVKDPGPVVVGATQGASCMGAAYEYLFNLDKMLRKHKVRDKVEITWITPEPVLGDFGIGGVRGGEWMLKKFNSMLKINYVTNASIKKIEKDKITLENGKELDYKLAMLIPPFIGADVIFNSPNFADDKGFIPVNNGYQHHDYKNVYAAGLSVKVGKPEADESQTICADVAYGVPKTGYPTDIMAKIAAENIANEIFGKNKFKEKPFGEIPGVCIMDAGYKEVYILSNHLFKPRQFEIMVPNPLGDMGKVFLEKYMIWKNKHGYSNLP